MYDKQQWQKVLTNIHRKSELDKSREFANQILTRFQHLERERARTDRETKKAAGTAGTNNVDKQKAAAPSGAMKKDASSSLNAGVKRPIEEVGKVLTASAAKKVLIGDVRNPMPNSNAPKSAAPSVPARNGPSSNGGEKKSATMSGVATSTIGQSPTSTTATVSTKKPPSSSGFFKSLSKPAEAPTKFVLPESHPMVIRRIYPVRIAEANHDHVILEPPKRRQPPLPPHLRLLPLRAYSPSYNRDRRNKIARRRMLRVKV